MHATGKVTQNRKQYKDDATELRVLATEPATEKSKSTQENMETISVVVLVSYCCK